MPDELELQPTCCGENCYQPASLSCPTCVKLKLPRAWSRFCDQACFKKNWNAHKLIHAPVYDPFEGTYKYTGTLRAMYPLSPRRSVPLSIPRPDYAETGYSPSEDKERRTKHIEVLSENEIEKMRVACKLAREVLDLAGAAVAPGVTTDDLDRVVHAACLARGCYPSPLNYMGFPKSCCTSVNEVICHGIPDRRPLVPGDIVNIDVSLFHRGVHADLSEMYPVGHVCARTRALVDATRAALRAAIALVRPGTLYRDLGATIQRVAHPFGVVRTYCGHGIHRYFHCNPNVPHYANNKAVGIMKPGHVFTIEPMITEGNFREDHWPDQWTAVTRDGQRSAQFEHTLLVTPTGCEILTLGIGRDTVMDGLDASWDCTEEV